MVFFGWGSKEVLDEKIDGSCLNCGRENLYLLRVQRVLIIHWIPFLPLGKKVYVFCSSCKEKTLWDSYKSMVYSEPRAIDSDHYSFKTHWGNYSGLLIVLALGVFAATYRVVKRKEATVLQSSPRKGMYFVFKIDDENAKGTPFALGKIEKIQADILSVRVSEYLFPSRSDAAKYMWGFKNTNKLFLSPHVMQMEIKEFNNLDIHEVA